MQRTCRNPWCGASFEVTEDDLHFYEKISPLFESEKCLVPPPLLCRDCRLQRRLAWRNERSFYRQTCGNCGKSIVSAHPLDVPYPVFCNRCWWSDKNNAKVHGRAFDFRRPFFDQFAELRRRVSQIALINDDGVGSENCEYCQDYAFGKNCYFMTGSWHTENSFYCTEACDHSRSLCDCTFVFRSELVYESTDSRNLYHCAFVQNCENCSDCFFGLDLRGCRNCFCCVGLRQKQFHIFNKPHNEEDYRRIVASSALGTHTGLERVKSEFSSWALRFPRKNMVLEQCENCRGNFLFNSKNTFGFGVYNAEDCKFYDNGDTPKFTYDVYQSGRNLLCYEGMVPDDSYMTLFTLWCWKCKNTLLSEHCHSSEHLFGCIALKREKYCTLNKQYTKEEYERLVPKIVEHMRTTSEWGEFFPIRLSPYAYNETTAQELFPLSEEEVRARGWHWKEADRRQYQSPTCTPPDVILDVPDTIVEDVLACTSCKRNYKIIQQELKFYRQMELPLPHQCFECRHLERRKRRTPPTLWERPCMKCRRMMETPYSPDRPEIVYCENCYLKEVY